MEARCFFISQVETQQVLDESAVDGLAVIHPKREITGLGMFGINAQFADGSST
jgi:hypothetical protein